jgi:hypothetical protein
VVSVLSTAACSGDAQRSPVSGAGGASASQGGHSNAGTSAHAGASTVGPNTSLEDFPQVYAEGVCQLLIRCFSATAIVLPSDCASFFERLFREQNFPHIETAIAEGRIEYHADAVAQCIEEVSTASCDATLLPFCSRVFVGTKKTGEACTLDLECVDQECAVNGACPGACAPPVALGATCTTENRCEPELTCQAEATGDSRKCVANATKGQPCSKSVPCRGYMYCSGRDPEVPEDTGVCVERASLYTAKQGEPCESASEPLCEPSLVCTTRVEAGVTVGSCQPRVASGAACTFSSPDACPEDEYCRISSADGVKPATGTCTPRPGLGEECRYGTFGSAPCAADQFCNLETKLCAESKHLGEACSLDEECYSNRCSEAGKCVALLECEKSAEP